MIESLTSRLADPDMQAAPAALLRAALHARELARQTGTPLIVMREGELVEEPLKTQAIVPASELKDRNL